MTRNPRAGFSAFELGLCILCIGAMMAVIATINSQASQRGRMAGCGSNQKQLVLSMHMYMADHGGAGPRREPLKALYPYVKNTQVFSCPSNPLPPQLDVEEWGTYGVGYQFRLDAWNDDPPGELLMQDAAPDLHYKKTWLGARNDGAVRQFPADEWRPLE